MKRCVMLNEKREGLGSSVLFILCVLMISLLLFSYYFSVRFIVVHVEGSSMLDTLSDGDFVYADSGAVPERGDVVIVDVSGYPAFGFMAPDENGERIIIKRVIAVEGDAVKCEKGVLYLRKAGEDGFSPQREENIFYPTPDFDETVLAEGEIYVLGDHRDHSTDSEDVGALRAEDVRGVVPEWAIRFRSFIAAWEGLRESFSAKFSALFGK